MEKEELMNIKFYQYDYAEKFLLRTEPIARELQSGDKKLIEFLASNQIELIEDPIKDIVDGANFMVKNKGYETCLIEGGTKSYGEYLFDSKLPAPSDVFVLTVLKGLSGSWVGDEYAGLDLIKEKYDIINTSKEIQTSEGKLQIFTMLKKDISV